MFRSDGENHFYDCLFRLQSAQLGANMRRILQLRRAILLPARLQNESINAHFVPSVSFRARHFTRDINMRYYRERDLYEKCV